MFIVSTNPSRNYEVIGKVEASTKQQIIESVSNARMAQPGWAALSIVDRQRAIESFMAGCHKYAEEIAQTMSNEMGKPITAARGQVGAAIEHFKACFAMANKALADEIVFENDTEQHVQTREPLGVIACITPWNFPFLNIPWSVGQALIAGNVIVYKPSEEIIMFARLLDKLIKQSALPENVFTIIFGDGTAGELLVQQPVNAIHFTGSSKTGQLITKLAAKTSTPVLTELGGSAPGIVFEDADVDAIIKTLYDMRYDNSGQYCDGLKRLIVHISKRDEVIAALKRVNTARIVGDARDDVTDIGPLVAKRQLTLLEGQVADALEKGAHIEFGGRRPPNLQGAYYEPTLLSGITFDMRVWQEEVFGPVLPMVTFDTEAEAIELANDTSYGLGGFVFTTDKARYQRVARQLQTGLVAHNNALYFSPYSPFGGYKRSGNSRVNGFTGYHEVTQIKLISQEK